MKSCDLFRYKKIRMCAVLCISVYGAKIMLKCRQRKKKVNHLKNSYHNNSWVRYWGPKTCSTIDN